MMEKRTIDKSQRLVNFQHDRDNTVVEFGSIRQDTGKIQNSEYAISEPSIHCETQNITVLEFYRDAQNPIAKLRLSQ